MHCCICNHNHNYNHYYNHNHNHNYNYYYNHNHNHNYNIFNHHNYNYHSVRKCQHWVKWRRVKWWDQKKAFLGGRFHRGGHDQACL